MDLKCPNSVHLLQTFTSDSCRESQSRELNLFSMHSEILLHTYYLQESDTNSVPELNFTWFLMRNGSINPNLSLNFII